MGKLDSVFARVLPKSARIASAAELGAFMDSRSAFLAQKCIIEFCRVRTGVFWEKLFREAEFQQSLTRSCWRGYTPALAMVTEMVEGLLRPLAGERQGALRNALAALATRIRAAHALPPGFDGDAWREQRTLVGERLAAASLAPPRPVREMHNPMARLVFDALPLHVDLLANDFDYISNNLRMNLMRAHEEFVASADQDQVLASLLDD